MSLSTYSGLKTAVASWLNRSDLTSYIPDFITLAHSEIQAQLRHWRMLNRATATLDSQYTQYPPDFLEADYCILTTSPITELEVVAPRYMIQRRVDYGHTTGKPRLISFSEEIMVSPTPDQSYTLEMTYYQIITAMSTDSDVNWVLQHFPGLYLFGALKEAAPFLHEDERVPVWEQKFEKIMLAANKDQTSFALSGGPTTAGRVF